MGRFHRHPDGTEHSHDHDFDHEHDHEHRDVGDHSGYAETGTSRVAVLESILSENDRVADANRAAARRPRGVGRQRHVLPGGRQDRAPEAHLDGAGRGGAGRRAGGRHRHQPRRRRARGPRCRHLPREHERRVRGRVPPRRRHGPLRALAGSPSTRSTCCSSRTSATSCARRSSTSASTPRRWCTR